MITFCAWITHKWYLSTLKKYWEREEQRESYAHVRAFAWVVDCILLIIVLLWTFKLLIQ